MADAPQDNQQADQSVPGDWNAITPLLQKWSEKAHDHEVTNYEAAHVYRKRYNQLGIPLVILSGIVGTGIFATLQKSTDDVWRVLVGIVGIVTAGLTAAQTFLRYGERGEKHHGVATRYGAIKREIDATLSLPEALRGNAKKFLAAMESKLDGVEADAPDIDRAIYDSAHLFPKPSPTEKGNTQSTSSQETEHKG